jgi:PAS domain S-box-containing protein
VDAKELSGSGLTPGRDRFPPMETARSGALPISQLRAIFEHALDPILVTDGAGRYTAVNPAAARMFGLPAHQIIGKMVGDFAEPGFDVEGAWRRFLGEGNVRGEFRLRRADGEIRDVQFSAVANIAPDRHLSILRDVTVAKRNEVVLRQDSRRKDEFMAVLSHELRNPLGAVASAVQLLQALGPPDPRLKAARDIIQRQVGHLTHLVDELLDVSRFTLGKNALQTREIAASDAIALGVETSHPNLERRKQRLISTLPPYAIRLDADLNRLAQVVSNLLHNASKFSEDGSRIWLTLERDRATAVIRVRDEGIGIPADKIPLVFDPFSQFEPSRSSRGLGLGLTLVRALVELHRGTVEVASGGLGKGSEFVVRLPALPEAAGDGDRG